MLTKETARTLIAELRRAREEVAVLRAVDATVNAFAAALAAEPPRRGMAPDVIWQAEKELADAEKTGNYNSPKGNG